ncbi:hypothetical protein [Paraburkholderia sp. DHOC27]|uniref:hypothetical protein n=1 Tax=Paraburkholderia sp. DHOC27 TaxID=2303330 RepID=UPI000E3C3943|nr:hypothetical protein [Paraburkholderia sp. DHOC27]RFU48652.1 hypothetical protein D0B32_02100 [Paraburkholderia sp. DHOC27]
MKSLEQEIAERVATVTAKAVTSLKKQIADKRAVPALMHPKKIQPGSAEYFAVKAINEKYSKPFQAVGHTDPVKDQWPWECENTQMYRARLCNYLQTGDRKHSAGKIIDMALAAPEKFDAEESRIISDSWKAATAPGSTPHPILIEDQSGRKVTEWSGHKSAWLGRFKAIGYQMLDKNGDLPKLELR